MFKWITNFVEGMKNIFKKNETLEYIDNTINIYDDVIFPSIAGYIDFFKKTKGKDSAVFKSLAKRSGIKFKSNDAFLKEIEKLFKVNKANLQELSTMAKKELPDIITKEALTVREASILKIIQDYNIMAVAFSDILIYATDDLFKSAIGEHLSEKKKKEIIKMLGQYSELLSYYSKNNKTILSKVSKITDSHISTEDGSMSAVLDATSNVLKLPNIDGFTGNPIYHFRMWLIDRDVNKYEALKDKKKLIELKLLDLRARQDSEDSNPNLEKQIEYYEDKIESIEYKIRKIEDE